LSAGWQNNLMSLKLFAAKVSNGRNGYVTIHKIQIQKNSVIETKSTVGFLAIPAKGAEVFFGKARTKIVLPALDLIVALRMSCNLFIYFDFNLFSFLFAVVRIMTGNVSLKKLSFVSFKYNVFRIVKQEKLYI
jgi:hypothetical protein